MELGTVGLGRMGGNMAQRLINGGHKIVAFDPSEEARDGVVNSGGEAVASLADLVSRLSSPRAVWVVACWRNHRIGHQSAGLPAVARRYSARWWQRQL